MMAFKRVLLKLSGETIGGADGKGIDEAVLSQFAAQIAKAAKTGVQVAVVIGGGNIFRGLSGTKLGFDRVKGDQMGMLATVINCIALSLAIKKEGVKAEVFTATPIEPFANYYMRDKVLSFLEEGGVALLAGGTGNPFFTTDSGAALRACELGTDALLKGTKVDGVYDCDPVNNPKAVKYDIISFDRVLADDLKVMDSTAFALCRDNNMPIIVFNINERDSFFRLISGEKLGTLVSNQL
ncbi:MAG: UMP kinase [Bacteroidales bacterium]|nr:UMP kinase [Bacteroidales bacterium]